MQLKKLTDSRRYRDFVNERDKALERMLHNVLLYVSDELRHAMRIVQADVARIYPLLSEDGLDPNSRRLIQDLDQSLAHQFNFIVADITTQWMRFKRASHALAFAGELTAIHNAGVSDSKEKAPKIDYDQARWGKISDRIYLSFSRLRRKVIDAVEMAKIMDESPREAADRALDAFPKPEVKKRINKLQRSYKEAEAPKVSGSVFSLDFVDDEEYQEILDLYLKDYIPKWRSPRAGEIEIPIGMKADIVYPWQLEQEITDEFVNSVRTGEHEAAKAAGITQFVWVSVIDSHTDECCVWRDGLTTQEIKAKLFGEKANDECKGTVPPIHMNCRCRIVPATDDLPDVPESKEVEFEEWLNIK